MLGTGPFAVSWLFQIPRYTGDFKIWIIYLFIYLCVVSTQRLGGKQVSHREAVVQWEESLCTITKVSATLLSGYLGVGLFF